NDGYGHLSDLAAQKPAIESLGRDFNPQPFISPPPLAWLVTPMLVLPFSVALVLWTILLVAALVWTWYLLAPPGGLVRAAHLALLLGVFPVAFGVMFGRPPGLARRRSLRAGPAALHHSGRGRRCRPARRLASPGTGPGDPDGGWDPRLAPRHAIPRLSGFRDADRCRLAGPARRRVGFSGRS